MPLLAGCAANFECEPVNFPVNGHVVGPWVVVRFASNDGMMITVGNQSFPGSPHTAIVKSFEYGTSNGHKATIEIVDEEGGAFNKFVDKINKCIERTTADTILQCQWGWIKDFCRGGPQVYPSPIVTLLPLNIDVAFSSGIVKYTITAVDGMQTVFTAREDETVGTDSNPMPLKQAIQSFMNDREPRFITEFFRKNPDGSLSTWEFQPNPSQAWKCDNQNKLACVQKWIEPFKTDGNKGIMPTIDNTANAGLLLFGASGYTPTVIFWEDLMPGCNESKACAHTLGTFIVNGGRFSNVISFNPNINWPAAFGKMSRGGNSGAAVTGRTQAQVRRCNVQGGPTSTAGIQQSIAVTDQARNTFGEDAAAQQAQGQNAHDRANSVNTEGLQPINAELKIQGNPYQSFVDLKLIVGTTCAIVVINPFRLVGGGTAGFCEWLAEPQCNEVLSNKSWMVKGVSHSIKEGSYVTTLNLFLATPGVDIDAGLRLGGPGSGSTFQLNNTC